MKSKKTVRLGAIGLPVGEVDDMLNALESAKSVRNLDGRQRQHLEDACKRLARARERPVGRLVEVPVETAVLVMRCVAMTQQWYQEMFAEFASVELD